jgi:serine/threonine protein kinase
LDAFRRAAFEVFCILGLFHRHGLVLIDFKPDNVIRLRSGSVKLVDLGACYAPRHRAELGKFVYAATPDHAEVLIDASNLQAGVAPGAASDVFSAGVALFEMATGETRLAIDAGTAEDMLATPAIHRFRDSQIADVWKAFPHLREALPTVQTQLRERHLLFSELWQLLKAYLAVRVPDWEALPQDQQDQILLSTGTTFIMEPLPAPLAWLGGAIARATVLRSLRVPGMGELVALLSSPAPEEVLADIAANNCFVRHIAGLDLPVEFATRLNTWDVRQDSTTGHWAISALVAGAELGDNAAFVHLHFDHEDEEGHAFWHVVDEFEADVVDGVKANVELLRCNHRAWLGTSRQNHAPIPA